MTFAEALLLLLPPEAGGRDTPVAPREGSYLPFASWEGETFRVRVIEGPPLLLPGEEARVMVELASDVHRLGSGCELRLYERDRRMVGELTLLRVLGEAVPA